MQYDLIIVGDTPEAWSMAEFGAELGASTLVVRPVGGTPGASGLGAVLSAFGEDDTAASWPRLFGQVSHPRDLWRMAGQAHERQIAESARKLGIRQVRAMARFSSPTSLDIFAHGAIQRVSAALFVLAVGTASRRSVAIDSERSPLLIPEQVPFRTDIPARLIIVGGDQTATAMARLYEMAGSEVALVDTQGLLDPEQTDLHVIQQEIVACQRRGAEVVTRLDDGVYLRADAILFAANRAGATGNLGLSAAGLEADENGCLWCDDHGMTWTPTIAAAGEVIGYPRNLVNNPHRIERTIANKLGLSEQYFPEIVSFELHENRMRLSRVRTMRPFRSRKHPRPQYALRVFQD